MVSPSFLENTQEALTKPDSTLTVGVRQKKHQRGTRGAGFKSTMSCTCCTTCANLLMTCNYADDYCNEKTHRKHLVHFNILNKHAPDS